MEGLHPGHDLAASPVPSLPCQAVTAWSFASARALAAFGALWRRNPSASSRSSTVSPPLHVQRLRLVAVLRLDPAHPPDSSPRRHGDRRHCSARDRAVAVLPWPLLPSAVASHLWPSGRPLRDAPRQPEPSPPCARIRLRMPRRRAHLPRLGRLYIALPRASPSTSSTAAFSSPSQNLSHRAPRAPVAPISGELTSLPRHHILQPDLPGGCGPSPWKRRSPTTLPMPLPHSISHRRSSPWPEPHRRPPPFVVPLPQSTPASTTGTGGRGFVRCIHSPPRQEPSTAGAASMATADLLCCPGREEEDDAPPACLRAPCVSHPAAGPRPATSFK